MLEKYITDSGWRCGKFIREHFAFTNYFKKGAPHYYYKPALIALGKELKERNVNLKRYMELRESEADFQKRLGTIKPQKTTNKVNHTGYKIPAKAKNIIPTAAPLPSVEIIREDIKRLKAEFFEFKLSEYIFIYHNDSLVDIEQLRNRGSPKIKRKNATPETTK